MKQLSTRAKWAWALITIFVIAYALFPIVSIFATSFKLPSQLNPVSYTHLTLPTICSV